MTIATADAILTGEPFGRKYVEWWTKYPDAGYGPAFNEWAEAGGTDIGSSIGNGSAMRASPIGWATLESSDDSMLRSLVIDSVKPSHNSTEAMDGAFVIAKTIHRIICGHYTKKFDVEQCASMYPNVSSVSERVTIEDMLTWDKFTCRCSVTVPQAINCFLLSDDYEDCIRKSLLSQGDVDTIACMAGGIAEAYFWKKTGKPPISEELYKFGISRLTNEMLDVYYAFRDTYNLPKYD